ncbi:hypothetical protein EVAR_88796_1 [Eumeta japonica]|uniref:Uncharacterized protein n=1 Tax=Eumeta variegata TaxID=151549 RepID=A0A4C1YFN9_EUMVA|nr:hypothetical protein EVAR_88796_1 [Eumeta japonica]
MCVYVCVRIRMYVSVCVRIRMYLGLFYSQDLSCNHIAIAMAFAIHGLSRHIDNFLCAGAVDRAADPAAVAARASPSTRAAPRSVRRASKMKKRDPMISASVCYRSVNV